jgi:hypothetical protein
VSRLSPVSYLWTCWGLTPEPRGELGLADAEREPALAHPARDVAVDLLDAPATPARDRHAVPSRAHDPPADGRPTPSPVTAAGCS